MSSIALDSTSTALVLIDLQNGILAMKSAPYSTADVVHTCSLIADQFRNAQATVIYVRVDLINFVKLNTDVSALNPNPPTPPASAIEIAHDAQRKESDILITKRHWSAFINTDLETELRKKNIKTIVIGGISTNIGVESTARDAAGLGFDLIFLEDGMSAATAEAHHYSIQNIFPRIGRVRKAADLSI